MSPALPPALRVGTIEPQDAIAAFQRRGELRDTFRWQDVFQEENARAFAVAGTTRADVLQLFHTEVGKAVARGLSLEDFAKAVRPELQRKGWWGNVEVTDPSTGEIRTTRFDNRRLALIYDTNLRQSHAAGRWEAIQASKRMRPYLIYRTARDERVRASHRAWEGVCLEVDHDFWKTHYPQNGWGCRCTVEPMSRRMVDRRLARGENLKTEAPDVQWVPYVNPHTGEMTAVPRGIDPGFAYNPGMARDAAFFDAALRKALRQVPLSAATVVAQAQKDYPAMVRQATESFGPWFDQVRRDGQARGEVKHVGVIDPRAVAALLAADQTLLTAVISVRDDDVIHAFRDAKTPAKGRLPEDVYRRLPELLARAEALYRDTGDGDDTLLYVLDLGAEDGSRLGKLVIQLQRVHGVRVDGKRLKLQMNVVRSGRVVQPDDLRDPRFVPIWRVPR